MYEVRSHTITIKKYQGERGASPEMVIGFRSSLEAKFYRDMAESARHSGRVTGDCDRRLEDVHRDIDNRKQHKRPPLLTQKKVNEQDRPQQKGAQAQPGTGADASKYEVNTKERRNQVGSSDRNDVSGRRPRGVNAFDETRAKKECSSDSYQGSSSRDVKLHPAAVDDEDLAHVLAASFLETKTKIEYTSDTRQVSGKLPRDSEGTSHSASVDDRDLEKVLAASFLGTRALVEFPSDQPRDTEGASRDAKQTSASVFDDDLAHVMAAKYVAKSSESSEDTHRAQPPPFNKEERRDAPLRDDNRAQSPPNTKEERRDPLLRDDNLVQSPPNAKEERRDALLRDDDRAQAPPKAKEEPPQGAGARFFGAIGLRGIQKRLSWRPL